MIPAAGGAQESSESEDDPAAAAQAEAKLTKAEKAAKAAELAPTMTSMLADPGFPATASADLHVNVEVVVYMGGFHLSTLAFTTAFADKGYEIRSRVQTEGIVDTLVKTDAIIGSRGEFLETRVIPALYNSDITDRKQRQLVAISWTGKGALHNPGEVLSFPTYNLENTRSLIFRSRTALIP